MEARFGALKHRLYRSVNSHLASLGQYVYLVFGTKTYDPGNPSHATVETAKQLFSILESRWQGTTEKGENNDRGPTHPNAAELLRNKTGLAEARKAIHECDNLESLLYVTNESGFHILQMTILCSDLAFLELLVDEGCNVNQGKCTLPLHLACLTGQMQIVEYLLNHGADPALELGMCYPQAHHPVRHVPSRFHFLETNIYHCDSNHQLPVMFAIEKDQVQIVRLLLQGRRGKCHNWPFNRLPLHQACRQGAYECIRYLLAFKPDEVNVRDEEGMSPLLHSVTWGRKYVHLLEEAGAQVHLASNKSRTALHYLYAGIVNPLELLDTTRFLLGTGLEEDTCVRDANGNTAVHELICLLNRRVETFPHSSEVSFQSELDQQILQSLELLLQHNSDPNLLNNGGVTALHKLILLFDYVTSNEMTGMPLGSLPSREQYKVDFDMLYEAMALLLKYEATANVPSSAGRTPLILLLQCALNVDSAKMDMYMDGFLRCISLLCKQGAEPSSTLAVHITMVTCLSKLGQKCLSLRDEKAKRDLAMFLQNVLAILFQHGLNSNYCSLMRKSRAEAASGNILFEIVKLSQYIRQASDLDLIYNWVLTALQWGANPDIEPYPSDPVIYQSQSSIFLKNTGTQPVNTFMYEIQDFRHIFDGGHTEKLLRLFINSMDHVALYEGLNSAKVMSRFDPNRSPTYNFIQLVSHLSSQPRSLKQISRVAVYQAIDRQLKLKVPQLPLPKLMQDYLIYVD